MRKHKHYSDGLRLWTDTVLSTPIGPISAAVSKIGLVRLTLAPLDELEYEMDASLLVHDQQPPASLQQTIEQIQEYLQGSRRQFDLPIDWSFMEEFDRLILHACQKIPYGEVVSYGELGRMAGRLNSARAVGGVMARNPIAIVLPCHRVVNASRMLHGYSAHGGLDTKRWLLKLEGINVVGQKLV